MKEKDVIQGVLQDSKRCRQLASEIMKIIDEIKTHKKNKLKKINKDRKEKKGGTEAIVKV